MRKSRVRHRALQLTCHVFSVISLNLQIREQLLRKGIHKTKNIDFMKSYIGNDFDLYRMPYATPMKTEYIPGDEEQIPPGELAVYRGVRVEATDGKVGTLGEFLI